MLRRFRGRFGRRGQGVPGATASASRICPDRAADASLRALQSWTAPASAVAENSARRRAHQPMIRKTAVITGGTIWADHRATPAGLGCRSSPAVSFHDEARPRALDFVPTGVTRNDALAG